MGLAKTLVVIAGLDPAIHSVTAAWATTVTEWMPWSSHGMTTGKASRGDLVALEATA